MMERSKRYSLECRLSLSSSQTKRSGRGLQTSLFMVFLVISIIAISIVTTTAFIFKVADVERNVASRLGDYIERRGSEEAARFEQVRDIHLTANGILDTYREGLSEDEIERNFRLDIRAARRRKSQKRYRGVRGNLCRRHRSH